LAFVPPYERIKYRAEVAENRRNIFSDSRTDLPAIHVQSSKFYKDTISSPTHKGLKGILRDVGFRARYRMRMNDPGEFEYARNIFFGTGVKRRFFHV